MRYGYSSLVIPRSTFGYRMGTMEKNSRKQQEIVDGYDPENYTTERLFATAVDGTAIPINGWRNYVE